MEQWRAETFVWPGAQVKIRALWAACGIAGRLIIAV